MTLKSGILVSGGPGKKIVLVDASGRNIGQVEVPPLPPTINVKLWRCNQCGHEEPQTEQLKELAFQWLGPRTSKTSCPNCGSYTLQQAYDDTFTAGYFLVVKAKNGIKGKGNL